MRARVLACSVAALFGLSCTRTDTKVVSGPMQVGRVTRELALNRPVLRAKVVRTGPSYFNLSVEQVVECAATVTRTTPLAAVRTSQPKTAVVVVGVALAAAGVVGLAADAAYGLSAVVVGVGLPGLSVIRASAEQGTTTLSPKIEVAEIGSFPCRIARVRQGTLTLQIGTGVVQRELPPDGLLLLPAEDIPREVLVNGRWVPVCGDSTTGLAPCAEVVQ